MSASSDYAKSASASMIVPRLLVLVVIVLSL